jgi:hypothetical protein
MKTIRYALLLSALALPSLIRAQLDPEGSQVISYFPLIADGGSAAQKWTTSFTLINPHGSIPANAILTIYGNDGQPLALNFGAGSTSQVKFSIAPQGSVTYTSTAASSNITTGWAIVASSLPLAGVVQYRYSANGVPQQGVSVGANPASMHFVSAATINSGIALANPYSNSVGVTITVMEAHLRAHCRR